MLASLRLLNAPVRRYARCLLLTKPLPSAYQRPWARIGNSLLVRDYNDSRGPPRQRVGSRAEERARELIDYINSEFLSHKRKIIWDMVSGHIGLSVKECKAKYNSALSVHSKRTSRVRSEPAPSDICMTKLGYEFPRNGKAVERNWTPKEIARLRRARGTSETCNRWEHVAVFVGNGRTKQDCMDVWRVGCEKALRLADLRKEAEDRTELKKAIAIKEHWTPQELAQLRTLLDSKFDTNVAKLDAALAMFPQKSKNKVRTMAKYLKHDAWQLKLKQTEELEEGPVAMIHCKQEIKD